MVKKQDWLGGICLLAGTLSAWALVSSSLFTNNQKSGKAEPTTVSTALRLVAAQLFHEEQHAVSSKRSETTPATSAAVSKASLAVLKPVPDARQGSYEEVSRLLPRHAWRVLNQKQRGLVRSKLLFARSGHPQPQFCFTPGTPTEVINAFEQVDSTLNAYRASYIWTSSATNSSVSRGGPLTLTWSIVPDGVSTPSYYGNPTPSNLRTRFNTLYGETDCATPRRILREIFAEYERLTGVRYIEVNYDDGAAINETNNGILGVRADVRIAGNYIDGNSGVLAFNYYPPYGADMVLDTADNYYNTISNDSQRLRNIMAHEHGHGMGLAHTCPTNNTKLMEPYINLNFTGPQFDDILGAQRNYGDTYEAPVNNDTIANATSLGSLNIGSVSRNTISIDGPDDADVFAFAPTSVGRFATVTVTPSGSIYLEGPQDSGGCTAGTSFNPTNQLNLAVELLNSGGQVVASANNTVAGASETVSLFLPDTGPYYVRVKGSGSDVIQAYSFSLTLSTQTNYPPQLSLSLAPTAPQITDTLTATTSVSDPDGDPVTVSYTWRRNGTLISGQTGNTLNLAQLTGVALGDTIRVDAKASDGISPDATATASATLQETPSLVVTTLTDAVAQNGLISLREAINYANTLGGTRTINFAAGLTGTMYLNSILPAFSNDLTSLSLVGPTTGTISISGQSYVRVWQIAAGKSLSLSKLTFTGGYDSGVGGGLIGFHGDTFIATDCAFNSSTSYYYGGALYFSSTSKTISLTRCSFASNYAYFGGAFAANSLTSTLALESCSFDNNTSGYEGGAVRCAALTTSVSNCTFVGNKAGLSTTNTGGALSDRNGELLLLNCTFVSNTSSSVGGCVYDLGGNARVINCTFSGNTGTSQGSAYYQSQGTTVLNNTILSAPTGATASLGRNTATFTGSSNNIASDAAGGILLANANNLLNTNPLLNTVAANGGVVKTMSLQNGSPAIDAGLDSTLAPDNLTTDARSTGYARKKAGAVDIGAFESEARPITLSINDVQVTEGNAGQGANLTFTVSLTRAASNTITVDYATADGAANLATQPDDYSVTTGTLTFEPGELTKTISVPIICDALNEANETLFVNLNNATNTTIADAQGIGTIINDDPLPGLSINAVQVTEGHPSDETPANATFTVTLSAASGRAVTVNYTTLDGIIDAATASSDYTAQTGTLTFAPGELIKSITVPIVGDRLDEDDETFFINLSTPSNATITDAQGIGTILNDDITPRLSIDDVTISEGDPEVTPGDGEPATQSMTFTITLSEAAFALVTVDYATANGLVSVATQPDDYSATTGTLTFEPGELTKSITVPIVGDTLSEANESFLVNLSNSTNARIIDAQGTGTITDNDAVPGFSVTDAPLTEGNSGRQNLSFIIALSAVSGQTITVNYATANGTEHPATVGSDYLAQSGALTFTPGELSKTITVPIIGDTLNEANETFFVNLSNPTNATITDAQGAEARGVGTILNDDAQPALSINDKTLTEGNPVQGAPGTTNMSFAVTLSAASGQMITVDYAATDGLVNPATAGSDYNATSGTLTFSPGETAKLITVPIIGDTLDEEDETLFVNLSSAANATINDTQGAGTIVDNDAPPALSINDVSVTETNGGSAQAVFTITLSAPSAKAITVAAKTGPSGSPEATPGADYIAQTGLALTIAPGQISKTVNVTILGDIIDESDEKFAVNLSGAVNVTITDDSGIGTILDNDAPPIISASAPNVTEGNPTEGTPNTETPSSATMTFTIKLSAPSARNISVQHQTALASLFPANAGTDYLGVPLNTVIFLAGETTKVVPITIKPDLLDEDNERVLLTLTNPVNATLGTISEGIIVDDDATPTLAINDLSVLEGNMQEGGAQGASSAKLMLFNLTLSAIGGRPVTVNIHTGNGGSPAATTGVDYAPLTATPITFAPGQTIKQVGVTIYSDTVLEADEKFGVILSGAINATIADNSGIGTILNDDAVQASSPLLSGLLEAQASSSSSSLTLIFADTKTAQSANNFTVKLKGKEINVQSVERKGASVILLFPHDSLNAGDMLAIRWSGGATQATVE